MLRAEKANYVKKLRNLLDKLGIWVIERGDIRPKALKVVAIELNNLAEVFGVTKIKVGTDITKEGLLEFAEAIEDAANAENKTPVKSE